MTLCQAEGLRDGDQAAADELVLIAPGLGAQQPTLVLVVVDGERDQDVEPSSLPSLRATWADLERQRRLAYDLPWAHAVLRVLELDDYLRLPEHARGFVAQRIGISEALEDECLAALAHAGQIRRRRGKWTLTRVMAVDTRDDPEGNLRLKRHWAKVGAERLERPALPSKSQYSYNLFAISDEGLELIRQAHLQYYERL